MRPRLTIDVEAVARNWRALDALHPAPTETAAAVKANGYGLGATLVAPALWRAGCRSFFVAEPCEIAPLAAALATAGAPDAELYVFDGAAANLVSIVAAGARPVLNTAGEAEAAIALAARLERSISCAIRVETGMNRHGATDQELERIVGLAGLDRLSVALILSHLACADDAEHPLNHAQKNQFDTALARLRPLFPQARASLSATGGAQLGPDYAYQMIRPGVGLYGGLPFVGAEPCVRLDAPIIRVSAIAAGESSGYGATWTAARPSLLATLPVGYADGLPRALSNCGEAMVDGRIAPIVGRVSMDLTVIDVTDLERPPRVGERATLLDARLTIDRMAQSAGASGYEILTRLDTARRFERRVGAVT